MNTLVLMSAMPELSVPADQTHIVRSTAVLRNVHYGDDGAGREVLVSYDASELRSIEKIRVQAAAVSRGIEVLLDGVALPRNAAIADDVAGEFAGSSWSLDESTGVVEVTRSAGGRVAVVMQV
eukprot:COSAG02_NODE_3762_length_6271_cov_49.947181_5_plen_123_part_00